MVFYLVVTFWPGEPSRERRICVLSEMDAIYVSTADSTICGAESWTPAMMRIKGAPKPTPVKALNMTEIVSRLTDLNGGQTNQAGRKQ